MYLASAGTLARVSDVSSDVRAEAPTASATPYPIEDCAQLHDAIEAYGRAPANERAELRRFIVRRKVELGCAEVELPETWRIVRGEG